MNKFFLHCIRPHPHPIIRWNKPKDKGNQEVIFLAILSCSFCKTFPAVQDCSKLHMLSLACCAKKLAASCWERFFRKGKGTEWLGISVWSKVSTSDSPCLSDQLWFILHQVPWLVESTETWERNILFNVALFFQRASFLHQLLILHIPFPSSSVFP